jgi:hypothetical protein
LNSGVRRAYPSPTPSPCQEEIPVLKWKLMLTTLPFVLVVVALKAGLEYGLAFPGVVDFSEVGLVLTGGVFLIGFMLAGVMTDFKESEKLPAELACSLETVDETFVHVAATKPNVDLAALRRALLDTVNHLLSWMHGLTPLEAMFARLNALAVSVQALEKAGATPWAVRALNEVHTLRKIVSRMSVISRTSFIQSGYALLDTITAVILGLLMIARFKSPLAEFVLVAFVALIYIYMIRLIRDIDDPFEYEPGGIRGAAEVDLVVLQEYRARLSQQLGVAVPDDGTGLPPEPAENQAVAQA